MTRGEELLGEARDVLVVRSPRVPAAQADRLGPAAPHEVWSMTDPVPPPRERDAVVLLVRDLADLRDSAAGLANLGLARTVAVRFATAVSRLPTVTPRPHWPLEELAASRTPDSWVVLAFDAPVPARPVLLDLARAAVPSQRLATGWPALGARRGAPEQWPPADPGARVAVLQRLLDPAVDLPPDLVLLGPEPARRLDVPDGDHPVLGRPPVVVVVEPDLTWEELAELTPAEAEEALVARGPASLGPVDDQLLNPICFERDAEAGVARLGATDSGALALDPGAGASVLGGGRLSDVDLPAVRRLAGVRLAWGGGRGPQDYCRRLVELAATGVPLLGEDVPAWAGHLLPGDLLAALDLPADLTDRLRREEHSIVVRRAALRSFAAGSWRRGLARDHGLQEAPEPRVSILLATRRQEMVAFGLRQVARQRGCDVEVVLATHGFTPAAEDLDAFARDCAAPLVVVEAESAVPFGEVLNLAADRAGGDVLLKMDDDDWYGPDFVADLLLARGYSGADVVGCSAEFTFLEQLRTTTRQALPTEVYRPIVAGGTIMVDRATLGEVGGFRRTVKYVDAGLLGAVRDAGGSTYRSHGLGYVLRRGASGHTWDPGLSYFLSGDRAVDQWRGFRPSLLLEADARDVPAASGSRLGDR